MKEKVRVNTATVVTSTKTVDTKKQSSYFLLRLSKPSEGIAFNVLGDYCLERHYCTVMVCNAPLLMYVCMFIDAQLFEICTDPNPPAVYAVVMSRTRTAVAYTSPPDSGWTQTRSK